MSDRSEEREVGLGQILGGGAILGVGGLSLYSLAKSPDATTNLMNQARATSQNVPQLAGATLKRAGGAGRRALSSSEIQSLGLSLLTNADVPDHLMNQYRFNTITGLGRGAAQGNIDRFIMGAEGVHTNLSAFNWSLQNTNPADLFTMAPGMRPTPTVRSTAGQSIKAMRRMRSMVESLSDVNFARWNVLEGYGARLDVFTKGGKVESMAMPYQVGQRLTTGGRFYEAPMFYDPGTQRMSSFMDALATNIRRGMKTPTVRGFKTAKLRAMEQMSEYITPSEAVNPFELPLVGIKDRSRMVIMGLREKMQGVVLQDRPFTEAARIFSEEVYNLPDPILQQMGVPAGMKGAGIAEMVSQVKGTHMQLGVLEHTMLGKSSMFGTAGYSLAREGGRFMRAANLRLRESQFGQSGVMQGIGWRSKSLQSAGVLPNFITGSRGVAWMNMMANTNAQLGSKYQAASPSVFGGVYGTTSMGMLIHDRQAARALGLDQTGMFGGGVLASEAQMSALQRKVHVNMSVPVTAQGAVVNDELARRIKAGPKAIKGFTLNANEVLALGEMSVAGAPRTGPGAQMAQDEIYARFLASRTPMTLENVRFQPGASGKPGRWMLQGHFVEDPKSLSLFDVHGSLMGKFGEKASKQIGQVTGARNVHFITAAEMMDREGIPLMGAQNRFAMMARERGTSALQNFNRTMQGKKITPQNLIDAAKSAGLSQSDITRVFDITKSTGGTMPLAMQELDQAQFGQVLESMYGPEEAARRMKMIDWTRNAGKVKVSLTGLQANVGVEAFTFTAKGTVSQNLGFYKKGTRAAKKAAETYTRMLNNAKTSRNRGALIRQARTIENDMRKVGFMKARGYTENVDTFVQAADQYAATAAQRGQDFNEAWLGEMNKLLSGRSQQLTQFSDEAASILQTEEARRQLLKPLRFTWTEATAIGLKGETYRPLFEELTGRMAKRQGTAGLEMAVFMGQHGFPGGQGRLVPLLQHAGTKQGAAAEALTTYALNSQQLTQMSREADLVLQRINAQDRVSVEMSELLFGPNSPDSFRRGFLLDLGTKEFPVVSTAKDWTGAVADFPAPTTRMATGKVYIPGLDEMRRAQNLIGELSYSDEILRKQLELVKALGTAEPVWEAKQMRIATAYNDLREAMAGTFGKKGAARQLLGWEMPMDSGYFHAKTMQSVNTRSLAEAIHGKRGLSNQLIDQFADDIERKTAGYIVIGKKDAERWGEAAYRRMTEEGGEYVMAGRYPTVHGGSWGVFKVVAAEGVAEGESLVASSVMLPLGMDTDGDKLAMFKLLGRDSKIKKSSLERMWRFEQQMADRRAQFIATQIEKRQDHADVVLQAITGGEATFGTSKGLGALKGRQLVERVFEARFAQPTTTGRVVNSMRAQMETLLRKSIEKGSAVETQAAAGAAAEVLGDVVAESSIKLRKHLEKQMGGVADVAQMPAFRLRDIMTGGGTVQERVAGLSELLQSPELQALGKGAKTGFAAPGSMYAQVVSRQGYDTVARMLVESSDEAVAKFDQSNFGRNLMKLAKMSKPLGTSEIEDIIHGLASVQSDSPSARQFQNTLFGEQLANVYDSQFLARHGALTQSALEEFVGSEESQKLLGKMTSAREAADLAAAKAGQQTQRMTGWLDDVLKKLTPEARGYIGLGATVALGAFVMGRAMSGMREPPAPPQTPAEQMPGGGDHNMPRPMYMRDGVGRGPSQNIIGQQQGSHGITMRGQHSDIATLKAMVDENGRMNIRDDSMQSQQFAHNMHQMSRSRFGY